MGQKTVLFTLRKFIMNSTLIASAVVAIAALTGANAFAQGNMTGEAAYVVPAASTTSNTTRAQVQADFIQARQAGNVAVSNEGAFAAAQAAPSDINRADVRAEAAAWVKTHVLSNAS
jgi:hypothetical protein